jgi:hypothetical protein
MLIHGQYVESTKPKIGAYYIPIMRRKDQTPEEIFAQSVLLDYKPENKSNFFNLVNRLLKI